MLNSDLSLRWAQSICWFCHEVAELLKKEILRIELGKLLFTMIFPKQNNFI